MDTMDYVVGLIVLFVVLVGFLIGRATKPGSGWKAPYDPNTDVTRGNQDSDYQGP